METKSFKISYPSIYAGTDKSDIHFYSGKPDLQSIFYSTERKKRYFFVTDATVASLDCMIPFFSLFDDGAYKQDNLLILGSGEPYKTIDSVLRIVSAAFEAGFNRGDVFIGIGGGVICDLTAFAASIYKRGIEVQLIPTTLLAMVDASIGGKTGCDFENCKNIIGSFHPASNLYYFPEFVMSLPDNQYNSGLAEALKTGLLYDNSLYEIFKNNADQINNREISVVEAIIQKSVACKANVVEKDFTEQNIRAQLNLGHTFAHALESVAGLGAVTHGAAVAWGIGRAAELAFQKEYCREAFRNEIFDVLKMYNWDTTAIPPVVTGGDIGNRLVSVMRKDKKNLSNKIRIVILKDFQNVVVEEIEDTEILRVLK